MNAVQSLHRECSGIPIVATHEAPPCSGVNIGPIANPKLIACDSHTLQDNDDGAGEC